MLNILTNKCGWFLIINSFWYYRFAKRKLDEFAFLGNRLQVSYAPQFESISDTREKLEGRRREVLARLNRKFHPLHLWSENWDIAFVYEMNCYRLFISVCKTSLIPAARTKGSAVHSPGSFCGEPLLDGTHSQTNFISQALNFNKR